MGLAEETPPPRRRLLLVGDYPPPWGGIAVHVQALLELADREGFDARVLDIGRGRGPGRHPLVIPAGGGAGFIARLVAARGSGASIHVHISGNNPKSWLVALAAGSGRGLARSGALLTVHSGLAPSFLAGSASWRRLARSGCLGFSRVLCANRSVAGSLEESGVPAARLEVLAAFVAPQRVGSGWAPPAAARARERHHPLLAAALAPGPQYGEDVLLRAMTQLVSRLPDVGLLVFGPGTGDRPFQGRVAAHGLAGRVVALGELEHPAAQGVIALADVFVRPTRADGDSISVREALGLGVRVVASDAGHRPPGVSLFRVGDAYELAVRTEEILGAPPPAAGAGPDATSRILELWRERWCAAAPRGPIERGAHG